MDGVGEPPWTDGATRLTAADCPAAWAADRSIEFAEAGEGDEPWFLFTTFRKAPDAFVAPLPWPRRYLPEHIALPKLPEEPPTPPTAENREADYVTSVWAATLIQIRQSYYGGISYMDEQIGAIVRRLRAGGQLENTLIVFTSCHGNMLGDLGRMGASTPYDGAVQVPCIFHYEAGFEITGGVSRVTDTTCLTPTILDLAGVETPDELRGRSAKEILTVVGADWEEEAFQDWGLHALRTARWKLVEPREHPTWVPQLFDLEKDPAERTNLYGAAEAAGEQARLAARLQEWEEDQG
jgi:arylsulfatase A-like enzyme